MVCFLEETSSNPRAPWGARPSDEHQGDTGHQVSIHAPPGGRDGHASCFGAVHPCFNPRAPWGARPSGDQNLLHRSLFQSTRPLGGATQMMTYTGTGAGVSIHAPPGGRDAHRRPRAMDVNRFNPRAPWGARRYRMVWFLSFIPRFNPRAPWGARLDVGFCGALYGSVSIHAPPGGRDRTSDQSLTLPQTFQSTRPLGGATNAMIEIFKQILVSIHAPPGGRDCIEVPSCPERASFNPRAPWGARPRAAPVKSSAEMFQSTRPLGGATRRQASLHSSSHCFNPRAPWGARPFVVLPQMPPQ